MRGFFSSVTKLRICKILLKINPELNFLQSWKIAGVKGVDTATL
jgi:hypothetical protein